MRTIAHDLNTMNFSEVIEKIKPIMEAIFLLDEYNQDYDYLWDDIAEKSGPYLSIVSSSYYETIEANFLSEVCWECFKKLMVNKFTLKFLGSVA